MSVFLSSLVTYLQQYGYVALWIAVFIAALGFPLPIALVLLAAGAFAALGDLNILLLAAIAISASVAGDNIGYLVGRFWGSKALDWLEHSKVGKRFLPPRTNTRSRAYFKRHGGWAVFLSRFLVAALGSIINLVAGSELFPYRYFLACDISGEALGAMIPLALGFAFSASWEAVGDVLGSLSLFLLGLLLVAFLLIHLIRSLQQVKSKQRRVAVEDAIYRVPTNIPGVTPILDPPAPSSGPLSHS